MNTFHFGPIVFRGRPTRGVSSSGYKFKHQELGSGKHRVVVRDPQKRLIVRVTMSEREWVRFIGGG